MKEASHIQGDTTRSPLRVSPSLATPLIICLSFIVLNIFFANKCVKKKIVPHQPKSSPHVTVYLLPTEVVYFIYRREMPQLFQAV